MLSSDLLLFGCQVGGNVPRQELFDTIDRMFGDTGEHVAEIMLRVQAIQFRRSDKGIDRGGSFTAGIGAGEQVIWVRKLKL